MTFKDAIVAPGVAPPWHLGPVGKAFLQQFGMALDTLNNKMVQASEAHMPTLCDPTCLPYIGDDRLIPQGPNESTASYRLRLQQSIGVWKNLAGTPWGVLRAALGCVLPSQPRARTFSNTSAWDTFEQGADVTQPPWRVSFSSSPNVQWDGASGDYVDPTIGTQVPWWRIWLVLYATGQPWCTSSGTWGSSGKKWGDPSKSWGFSTPSAVFLQIQQVVRQWKAEHAWCRWAIVSFDDTLFDPWQTNDGAHNPAGTFGRWSVITNGQYVPARFSKARYFNV